LERQTLQKTQTTRAQSNRLQTKAGDFSSGRKLLELQSSIGNQAVQWLINSPIVQAKLNVGPPILQRKCDHCEGDECAKCAEGAQTKTSDGPPEQPENEREREPVKDGPPTETQAEEPAPQSNTTDVESAGPPANQQTERVSDAPAATYIVPFDRSPMSAPGERIIFSGEFTDPTPTDYRLEYTTAGGHFNSATGPTTVTIAGLISGNVNFFVPARWPRSALTVVLNVRQISTNTIVRTETWTFAQKTRYPTTMTQREGTGERAMPATYHYDIGPALRTGTAPFYEHQTILERFSNWRLANIVPADISGAYRTAHNLNNRAAISQHFLTPYAGSNGTFTVNADDRIADEHSNATDVSNLVANLVTPKDIEVALPQTYEARPSTALGRYTITRVRKTNGTWMVKKG
jgi:hypothetical protein